MSDLKRLAEIMVRDIEGDLSDAEARNFHEHLANYEAKTQPADILALLAEIERLRTAEGDAMTYKAGMENVAQQRDQLKAENARSTEREIMQLAEIEALRRIIGSARKFVAFAYAEGMEGAEEVGREIDAAIAK